MLGSKLNPIAAYAAGGPVAGAASYVGSSGARMLANKLEAGKANAVTNLIGKRPGVSNALGLNSSVPAYTNHLISAAGIPAAAINAADPANGPNQ